MRWRKLLFATALLTILLGVTVGLVAAQGGTPSDGLDVVVKVVSSPSLEDKDWPIVRVERKEVKDPTTGLVHYNQIVTREAPAGAVPAPKSAPCTASGTASATATCTYQGAISQYTEDVHLGGIRAHMRQYEYLWCDNPSFCDIFQPYKLEVYWDRDDSTWTALNATTRWGCGSGSCSKVCDGGGSYNTVYTYGPFDPVWYGNITGIYQYTTSMFPRLRSLYYGALQGQNISSGYHRGAYLGQMNVTIGF